MKNKFEKILEEGSSQDICTKYFNQAMSHASKISDTLSKFKNVVDSKKSHYYSAYDIKQFARQLEDISDSLNRMHDNAESAGQATKAYETEEFSEPVISEIVDKYKSILNKIKND